jgi:hypothetical protein
MTKTSKSKTPSSPKRVRADNGIQVASSSGDTTDRSRVEEKMVSNAEAVIDQNVARRSPFRACMCGLLGIFCVGLLFFFLESVRFANRVALFESIDTLPSDPVPFSEGTRPLKPTKSIFPLPASDINKKAKTNKKQTEIHHAQEEFNEREEILADAKDAVEDEELGEEPLDWHKPEKGGHTPVKEIHRGRKKLMFKKRPSLLSRILPVRGMKNDTVMMSQRKLEMMMGRGRRGYGRGGSSKSGYYPRVIRTNVQIFQNGQFLPPLGTIYLPPNRGRMMMGMKGSKGRFGGSKSIGGTKSRGSFFQTRFPTFEPSASPTNAPTVLSTVGTDPPSATPSNLPSLAPSVEPSTAPSVSKSPSNAPSSGVSPAPSVSLSPTAGAVNLPV